MAEPQQTKDQKMRHKMKLQGPNTQLERALSIKKESSKQKKHGMAKQLKYTKATTNEEHKQEQPAINTKTLN